MSRASISGEFVSGAKGPIFVLLRRPAAGARGCVLVVPPFAEEMNKCRRMVTELALGLAEQGVSTLLPDLYGTGDSEGVLADVDWATWQADLAAATRWSAGQGCAVTGILAIRLGCALVVAAAHTGALPAVDRTALWQPVFDGGRFVSQFLRLRIAASLMQDRQETVAELRTRLKAGETVEVAGYGLSGRLAADLDAANPFLRLPESLGEICWAEIAREPGEPLPPSSKKLIEQSRSHGVTVRSARFPGEPFWSSTEIAINRPMVLATLSHFDGEVQSGVG